MAPAFTLAASPWLPAPASKTLSLSYTHSSADEFFAGDRKMGLPTDLDQDSVLVGFVYGITDRLAVDFTTGYSNARFQEDPVLSPEAELDGLIDPRFGVRYRLRDEYEDGGVTLTLQGAGVIGGGYRTGAINAIGDDALGIELSALAGKLWENGLGLSVEVGYRWREDDVPNEWFGQVESSYALTSQLSARVTYAIVDAIDGIDIGGPGFTPARFPETEEDYQILSGGLAYNVMRGVVISVDYGQVLDGRNTSLSELIGFSVSYSF